MSHLEPDKLEELAKNGGSDPHLEDCAECQRALVAAKGRVMLLKDLRPYTLADVAFSRVEAKLMEEVNRPKGFNWARFGLGFALTASLALVAYQVASKTAPTPAPIAKNSLLPVKQAPLKVMSPQLSLLKVEGLSKHSVSGKALTAGEVLSADDQVETQGHLTLSAEKLLLDGKGKLALGHGLTADIDDTFLAAVEPSDETALVHCDGTFVGGADAAFLVSKAGGEVLVEVMRGEVRVSGTAQLHDALTLKAPVQAHMRQGRLVGNVSRPLDTAKVPVLPMKPLAKLDFDFPAGTQLELDGGKLGVTPLSVMWTQGKHHWRAFIPGKPVREGWVDLVGERPYTVRAPDEPRDIEPDEAVIADLNRSLKAQTPKLAACYEKWLKANPGAQGEIELTLTLASSGKVMKVLVDPHDSGMSREAIDCLVRNGKALVLPKLGSQQEVALPLRLQKR